MSTTHEQAAALLDQVHGLWPEQAERIVADLAERGLLREEPPAPAIDRGHLYRQAAWSEATFGPYPRPLGVLDHLTKEIEEVRADPTDLGEWVDVIILALDGALGTGHTPGDIIAAVKAKQERNEGRTWPDWRTLDRTKAIEHDRTGETAATPCDECGRVSHELWCPVFRDEDPEPEPTPDLHTADRCCYEHGHHVTPHRGCILR